MVKLLLKATSNRDKLANVIQSLTGKSLVDSVEIALKVSNSFKSFIEVESESVANPMFDDFSKKDIIQWSFLDDYGMEYGGNSGLAKGTQDCTLRIISLDKNNKRLVKALKAGLRIKEDHAELFAENICNTIVKNGIWCSRKISIDVLAWTAANPGGTWTIFNSAKEVLASNCGIAALSVEEENKQYNVAKQSVTSMHLVRVTEISKALILDLENLDKYCHALEEANLELSIRADKLLKEREGLLKERDVLSAKLDTLSDKFIKLKSIIE